MLLLDTSGASGIQDELRHTFIDSPSISNVPSVGAGGGIRYLNSRGTSSKACSFVGVQTVVFFDFFDTLLPTLSSLLCPFSEAAFSSSSLATLAGVKCFQNGGGAGKAAEMVRWEPWFWSDMVIDESYEDDVGCGRQVNRFVAGSSVTGQVCDFCRSEDLLCWTVVCDSLRLW